MASNGAANLNVLDGSCTAVEGPIGVQLSLGTGTSAGDQIGISAGDDFTFMFLVPFANSLSLGPQPKPQVRRKIQKSETPTAH